MRRIGTSVLSCHFSVYESVFGLRQNRPWSLVLGRWQRPVVSRRSSVVGKKPSVLANKPFAISHKLVHSRRSRCQRRLLPGKLHTEVPGFQPVGVVSVICGRAPDRSDIHFAAVLRHLRGLAALLLDVGLDHLRDRARGKVSVLAFLEQTSDAVSRIAPWLDANEPAVVLKTLSGRAQSGLQSVADGLGASGL